MAPHTHHMVIGPNGSDFTEIIPVEYLDLLVKMEVLRVSEVVDHNTSERTIIYRTAKPGD